MHGFDDFACIFIYVMRKYFVLSNGQSRIVYLNETWTVY